MPLDCHNRALHRGRCHVRGAAASLCHVQASPAATTNGFTVNSESTAVSATALSTCRRQHDGCQRGYHPQLRNCWCSACWYMWLGAHRMWLGAHRTCTRVGATAYQPAAALRNYVHSTNIRRHHGPHSAAGSSERPSQAFYSPTQKSPKLAFSTVQSVLWRRHTHRHTASLSPAR